MKAIFLPVLIATCEVKGHRIVPLNAELYHCTVLFNADVTGVQWLICVLSCDPVSSNQMTRIYRGIVYNRVFDNVTNVSAKS